VGADLDPLSATALADADKTRTRNVEIVQEYAARGRAGSTGKPLTVRFRFLASPVELLGDEDGHVRAVRIERNEIVARGDSLGASGTGEYEEIPAQLVFRSIGYRGLPLASIPFDEGRGLIRNDGGRVCVEDGSPCPGEYVTGWIKRGPSGVIGTNKKDSQDTVNKLLEDAAAGRLNEPTADDIEALLAAQSPHHVEWDGWEAIDAVERAAGEAEGRPRVKLAEWEALREASKAPSRR
jgi:ferredoxin--NADP+ reductase